MRLFKPQPSKSRKAGLTDSQPNKLFDPIFIDWSVKIADTLLRHLNAMFIQIIFLILLMLSLLPTRLSDRLVRSVPLFPPIVSLGFARILPVGGQPGRQQRLGEEAGERRRMGRLRATSAARFRGRSILRPGAAVRQTEERK